MMIQTALPPYAYHWVLNTSNRGKQEEFKKLFAEEGLDLEVTMIDLAEIKSDPLSVVVHKASQLEPGVLVEDTSLQIEGVEIGVNVRWFASDELSEYAGRKATWTVLLAYAQDGVVTVFEGKVYGTIVSPRGVAGFGFDPIFLPHGSHQTLAENKPNAVNARALAVKAFAENRPIAKAPVTPQWNGSWQ